jgi:cysteine desulfurase
MLTDYSHSTRLADRLLAELAQLDGVHFNGNQQQKLANIINVSFDEVSSDALLMALKNEVAIASGSACNSGAMEASHVLRSMGIEGDRLYGAVRISFGRYTTEADSQQAVQRLVEQVTRLRCLARA